MHDTLEVAKKSALNFRSEEVRLQTLEKLREELLPMVEWLDKSVKELYPYKADELVAPMKRAMPVFAACGGELHQVALARKHDWIIVKYVKDTPHIWSVSSGWLVAAISERRHSILGWDHNFAAIEEIDGMREVVEHCAFMKYLATGVASVRKLIGEREERLQIMSERTSFLGTYVAGLDPVQYADVPPSLPGYSLWHQSEERRGSASRSSPTYLLREPVEKRVKKHNASPLANNSYFVYDGDGRELRSLDQALLYVTGVFRDIEPEGDKAFGSKREPLYPEEKETITRLAKNIGVI
ncbi:hypothetical protein KW797_00540 [Candidatus Parcubacteria bacterium]|nr:hypothetical protein [Candidatus Parcubacteria bacterium]